MTSDSAPRPRRRNANNQAVLDALRADDTFRSAQQLYFGICARHPRRIALTSVYRILHHLSTEGIAETQRAEHGEVLYRLNTGREHRHYLLCRRCGRAVSFIPTALEEDATALSRQHGFTEVTHRIDLYGVCPRCHATA